MRKILSLFIITLVLASCGTSGNRFKVKGRFLNLNQGEFYVYSLDGLIDGMDTIKVTGGRFSYSVDCTRPGVLMIVFPNFSEQPIFAQPKTTVEMKADASHLKEMTVEGTDDNKLMTAFRKTIADASPPQAAKAAEDFIGEHPESPVSAFLLRRYFVQTANPDYGKALQLATKMMDKQPKNGPLARLKKELETLRVARTGMQIPAFSATDVKGRRHTSNDLHGKVAVINVWATWSFESQDTQRRLKVLKNKHGQKLAVLGICIDPSRKECMRFMKNDSLPWPTVCDEMVFDSPLLKKIGVKSMPDNIIMDTSGKVVARGLKPNDLRDKLEQMLK